MADIDIVAPGTTLLMMGNEAIARGALEAGVGFAAAYPGTPASEVLTSLATISKRKGIFAEWASNELTALQSATGAALTGIRAISATKCNGTNTLCDHLATASGQSVGAGLVLISCDDPGPNYSPCETDTRGIAKWLEIPLLEPGDFQDCKDMTKWLFELSEEIDNIVMLRSVGKIAHGRGNVRLGELPTGGFKTAHFDLDRSEFQGRGGKHTALHKKLIKVQEIFEASPFNQYAGPDKPELLVITCGTGWLYSSEVVRELKLEDRVGILKLGTIYPIPVKLIGKHLAKTQKVLFVEETDPFLENSVAEFVGRTPSMSRPAFYGKHSNHISITGTIYPDMICKAITSILGIAYQSRDVEYDREADEAVNSFPMERHGTYCPGCSHKASYWAIHRALMLDGREGFTCTDIGCYGGRSQGPESFSVGKTSFCLGSGIAIASGMGVMEKFGYKQPVMASCGDSTFFHLAIPGLINAVYFKADVLMFIFDNDVTATTGFQPHPGTGKNAVGEPAPKVSIEGVCRACGAYVEKVDPHDLNKTTETVLRLLRMKGVRVLILERDCELIRARREGPPFKVHVDPEKCVGESCGCNRLCTRIYACSAIKWNPETGKSEIDEVSCAGCGVCADVCPKGAIVRVATEVKRKESEELATR